ncbi:MAG: GNAT family N-acetyltransferase [Rhodospirillales bacterium]|nr:GNAT family N-acetyltransferase [Alphaproteobacteria bacterium]MCB9987217.1 GNAT family N-acetyltransferase [Rhodospirillales bacterium]USO07921.1 MAG: GNAT family N-acetyltransferase [Rhodospirillales bacterium]
MVGADFLSASQRFMPPETGAVHTPRLIIRPYTQADAPQIAQMILERQYPYRQPGTDDAWAQEMADETLGHIAASTDKVVAGLFLRQDGQLAGEFTANAKYGGRPREWSLSYYTRINHRGRGYMKECVLAVLPQFPACLGARIVSAMVSFNNLASRHILKDAGFREATMSGHGLSLELTV